MPESLYFSTLQHEGHSMCLISNAKLQLMSGGRKFLKVSDVDVVH